MSLQEQQNLMARLYMDEDMRRAFLSDPAGVARPFGLSTKEIEDIAAVLPGEIAGFADSLFRKRLREVEKMIPLTKKALDESFEPLFAEYLKAVPEAREKKRMDDVLDFCVYLLARISRPELDAVKFEMLMIEFHAKRRSFVFARYDGKYHFLLRVGKKTIRRTY